MRVTFHEMPDWEFNHLLDAISQYKDHERRVSAKEKPDTYQWSKYREAQRTEAERAMSILLKIAVFHNETEEDDA